MLLKHKTFLRLISTVIITILFSSNSSQVYATTPVDPTYGVQKTDSFVIRLPYASGNSYAIGWGYGKCNWANTSSGDHCNASDDPNNPGKLGSQDYYALDFPLRLNEPVYAIAPGKVKFAGLASGGWASLGYIVFIDHNNGYQSLYTHLSAIGLAVTGQTIYANTTIGKASNTGANGINVGTVHLHFALYEGAFMCSGGPCGGKSVVPEPFIGRQVYEGFDKWHGPLEAANLETDSIPPSSARWGAGTTSNSTTISQGQNIVFVVDGLPSDTKEVRLTAWYNGANTAGWSTMGGDSYNENWRILARCWPGINDTNCSWQTGSLSHTWDLYNDTRPKAAPWQDENSINLAYKPNSINSVCISFDVFDNSGNAAYAPAGVKCDPVLATAAKSDLMATSSEAADSARIINVSPYAPPSITWSTHFYYGQDHWGNETYTGGEMCTGSFSQGNLDQNYPGSPCSGNTTTDNWVGDYKATVNFQPGYYSFWVDHDDGLKLKVDGREIYSVNGTHSEWKCVDNGYLYLSGNHDIWAILAEQGGEARVKVEWSKSNGVCDLPLAFNKTSPANGLDEQSINPILSWNASIGAQSYSYCVDTTNDNKCDNPNWYGANMATSVGLSGLNPETTYYWQVKAYSQGGVGTEANNGTWGSFTTQSPTPPFNLLMNNGFEEGTTSPTWWGNGAWQMPYSTFEWSNIFSHSGVRSVKLANNTANDAYWNQTVNVQPNSDYRLSGWIMTDNIANSTEWDDAGANLSILDGSHRYTSPKLHGDNPWTYVSLDFNSGTASQVTIAARLGMYSGTTTGWAWFDDLKLIMLSSPTCYNLTKNVNGNGSISTYPAPNCNNGTQYIHGTTVALTSVPNSNNSFTSWAGDASGTNNPVYLTMTANKSATANFDISTNTATGINIGGNSYGSYNIPSNSYLLQSYPGTFGGPVFVDSTNNVPDVASIRLLYLNQFGTNTLSELMGVPTSGLLDNYWMPLYLDDSVMDSQIRFTNTSPTLSTDVKVYIGGVLKGTYTLAPNSATRVRYQGFSGGPVQIVGTPGVPILAGMRIIYAGGNSFDEIMAYPTTQLSNEYWFPFYNHNNVNLDTEIRVGNTSPTLSSTVDVYIGGALKGTYTLAPNTSKQISYPGFFGGPVRIVGTVGVPIVSSMRLLYLNQYSYFTLSELMGVPTAQLLDDYAMPVYLDDTVMDSQVRFTNTSTTLSTTVNVYLGANLMGTYVMPPSSANRIRFTGVSGGPVRIVGTPGVPILAGMRIIYQGGNSFDEIMAYPTTLLSPEYWFPFYNHNMVNLDTEVRVGVP